MLLSIKKIQLVEIPNETFSEQEKDLSTFALKQRLQFVTKSISVPCLTWRKAQAIHNWFVTNVQNSNDNCDTQQVSVEKLNFLNELCEKILKVRHDPVACNTLLEKEPEEDFEFQIDSIEYTYKTLIECISKYRKLIKEHTFDRNVTTQSFEYQSSW